ncbi:MAG: hypothetical protein JJU06_12960 [Ectothiorhodospiraceae bacterium]|nr:hypothetical protein [Ectothiorhodospiraceae bacterium]MCH8506868.1 hypothetical protein [Ectothiorhodospiraceae bacterium]
MSQFPGKESLISVSPLILAQLDEAARLASSGSRDARERRSPVRVDIVTLLNGAFTGSAASLRRNW